MKIMTMILVMAIARVKAKDCNSTNTKMHIFPESLIACKCQGKMFCRYNGVNSHVKYTLSESEFLIE